MAHAQLKLADDNGRRPTHRIAFSIEEIETLKPPAKGRRYVYDQRQPALAVAITERGHRAFYFYKKSRTGRPIRLKIGDVDEMSIENARRRAASYAGQVADGKDPAAERRETREATTLAEVFELYMEQHAKLHKRSWQADQTLYNRNLKKWANRRLDAIKRPDVVALHARIGKRCAEKNPSRPGKVAANRTLALLSTIYSFAERMGFKGENPCKGVKRFTEKPRQRYLHPPEMRRFLRALKDEPSKLAKHALWLMLLTAQRRETVLDMRWADIDLATGIWTVPETKAGRTHEVPLTPLARAILSRQRAKVSDAAEYILEAKNRFGRFSDPIPAVKRVCERAGITGRFTPHDIRRTWASWAIAAGVPHNVVQRALDHAPTDITSAIYAHVGIGQLREGYRRTERAMIGAK